MKEAVVRTVIGCRHHLPIGALYNKWHSTPSSLLNPYHSRLGCVNPIPAPVPNTGSLPLRDSSFLSQVPGTTQGETPLIRSSAHPHPIQKPSRESSPYLPHFPLTRKRGIRLAYDLSAKIAESRKHTGKM